ncbi:MAG: 30S ribosomal protein S6 [Bacteroidota bacterium]
MYNYETVFILTPVLTEDQATEVAGKFKNLLKELGAVITHDERWGLKKLPIAINGKTTGYYYLFEYNSDGTAVAELERAFKRDERILRFTTARLDPFGNKPVDSPVI